MNQFFLFVLSFGCAFSVAQAQSFEAGPEGFIAQLARGNQILFPQGTTIYTHPGETSVATVIVTSPLESSVDWLLPSGETLKLNCNPYLPSREYPYGRARVMRFYPSGEYELGCDTVELSDLSGSNGNFVVQAQAKVYLFENGELKYARHLESGQVTLDGQQIPLLAGSEVSFHNQGGLDFFTPQRGVEFYALTDFGDLLLKQSDFNPVYFRFMPDGHLQNAILGEELTVDGLNFNPGDGISFDKDGQTRYLDLVITEFPKTIESHEGYSLKATYMRFHPQGYLGLILIEEDFDFTHPETGQIETITAPSQIYFDQNRNIMRIDIGQPTGPG